MTLSIRGAGVGALVAAMAAVGAATAPVAQPADKVVWNINVIGPPRAITRGLEYMAEELNKAGAYEGVQMCVGYYPNKFPLL
jgi:hypothetical protein